MGMTGQPSARHDSSWRWSPDGRRHPNMHIYRYAPKKTALLRLVRTLRHRRGRRRRLAAQQVLVDLYPLVRKSIRVGTDSFSEGGTGPLSTSGCSHAPASVTYRRLDQLPNAGTLRTARGRRIVRRRPLLKESRLQRLRLPVHPRAEVTGCSCAPGKPASHRGAQPVPDADPIDDGDFRWRRYCPSSPAMPPPAAYAGTNAVALTLAALPAAHRRGPNRSGGRTDRLNYPVDDWSDGTDLQRQRRLRSPSTGMPPRAQPQRRVRLPVNWRVGTSGMCLPSTPAPPGMTG